MKLSARFSRLSLGRIARSANVVLTLLFVLSLVLHFRVPIGDLLSLPITAFSQARVDAPYLPLGLLFLVVSMVVYIVRISLIWLGSERPHAPSQDPSLAKLLHMPTVVGLLMWLPRHIFDRFIDSSVHDVLRKLEPLGVVVAALALVYAALGLRLANQDSEARRMETQMTFRLMLDDDLATARAPYKSSMTSRDDPGETNSLTKSCGRDYPMSVISRDPLVSKLENFARFGVPLDRIDATFLPLRDLSLEGAELKSVGFAWSDLQGARFSGSKLENALFFCSGLGNAEFATTDANIRTRLRGADFRFATLAGADFSGADFA